MKKHTQRQIDNARDWATAQNFEKVDVKLENGLEFSYFVMPQSLNPELPHFVWQCSNQGQGVFGVADTVPAHFRKVVVAHEVYESLLSPYGTCAGALDLEFSILAKEDHVSVTSSRSHYVDYMRMRQAFFRNLIAYTINPHRIDSLKTFSIDLPQKRRIIEEFQGSLDRLEARIADLSRR